MGSLTGNLSTGTSYLSVPTTTGVGATQTQRMSMIAAPGKIGNFRMFAASAPGTGGSGKQYVFTVEVNGSATAITCTIFETATSCTDTTHTVSVSAGDRIDVKQVATNTPTGSIASFSIIFQPTTADNFVLPGTTIAANVALQMFPMQDNGAESVEQLLMPEAGTISSLYAWCDTNVAASASRVWALRVGGVDQTLTCTMAAGTSTCNDTTHSVSVSSTNLVSYGMTVTGTPGTNAGCAVGTVFVPTTAHRAVLGGNTGANTTPTNVTRYGAVQGTGSGRTGTAETVNAILQRTQSMTAKKIFVNLNATPAQNVAFTLRKNATTDTGLTCTVAGAGTACNATVDATLVDDDSIDMEQVPTGTATARTPAWSVSYEKYGSLP